MSGSAPAGFALRHPDRRSAYPQRIVDVAAADAPGVTGTTCPAAPASAVAAARNAAAGDRRRVDDRRSGCPGRLVAAAMDRRSGGEGPPCRVGRVGRVDDISSSGLISGYDKQEVDAFRRAVRDTFLGVRKPP
jgi:hypothetical protein